MPSPRPARVLRALAVAGLAISLPLSLPAPASAGSDPLTGQTITGRLVQAYPESDTTDTPAAKPLSWVQPATGAAVRLDTADLGGVPAGATVRVTVGKAVDDGADGVGTARDVTRSVVLGTGEPAGAPSDTTTDPTTDDPTDTVPTTDTTTGSSTTGSATSSTTPVTTVVRPAAGLTDRVAVVLVEAGGGAPDRTTQQDLVDAVDGPVHDFWAQQTGGAVDLGVTSTTDWVATPTTAGCDTPTALWDQAAAAAGFTGGPGNHLLVYVSSASADIADCSYGLAEIGSGLGSGGRLYVEDPLPSLIAHELGHNFGLGHSSGRQCDGAVDTGTCQTVGYRDYYDVMGASWEHVGTLNAPQEARLGVLPAAQRAVLTASGPGGTVTLAPLAGRTGVRALELTATDGTDYWLEYRSATGQDAWLGTPADRLGLQAGVLLHRSGSLPDTSLLLDGTPSAAAGWNADLQDALPVGTPVSLAGGLTVTVTAVSSGAASVTVTTAAAPAPPPQAAAAAPARGCRTASCTSAPSRAVAPAAPPALGTPYRYTIAGSGAPAHRAPVRTAAIGLAAFSSPAAVGAAGALVGVAVLGGMVIARRLRSRAVRTR